MTGKSRKLATALIAAAVVAVLGVGVFAASGGIGAIVNSSSNSWPDYTSLPSERRCVRDAGYAPTLIERFENGYAFQDGRLVHSTLTDEAGSTIERYDGFSFTYAKDGDEVVFDQEKYDFEPGTSPAATAITVDGTELYYSGGTHKIVPLGYEPTEEEEAAVEAGTLSFGYTDTDAIEQNAVQILFWQTGNMHYSLFQMNGALSAEELAQMASEIIAAQ